MNRIFIFLIFFCSFFIFADSYDEGLKYEAKGEYKKADEAFNNYFKENLNDINQDSIIEKLIHSATLKTSIYDSLDYLLFHVKFMKNPNSRYRVYLKIAEIYELLGELYNAGKYYEKAAYTNDAYIDYNSIFNSVRILIELGNYNIANKKLIQLEDEIKNSKYRDRFNLLLSYSYFKLNNITKAKYYYLKIKEYTVGKNYLDYLLFNNIKDNSEGSIDSLIMNDFYYKLRSPGDYTNKDSEVIPIPKLKKRGIDEVELFIGIYESKESVAGTLNIINQMGLNWYLDESNNKYNLYIFTTDVKTTRNELEKVGIKIKE